jgi:tetratricopeptide (TPR) repeat protein
LGKDCIKTIGTGSAKAGSSKPKPEIGVNAVKLQDEGSLSSCRKNLFAFTALAVVIFAIYSNTFNASWHFDDFVNLVDHPGMHLNSLRWPEIKETFFANRGKLNRPVSAFSLALNYYFSGNNVSSYHLVNIIIHCLSAVFLFLFIVHTLKLPAFEKRYGNIAYSVALLSSLFWAINPVQTQAVTYVVQRMASLAGLFYVMALYAYVRARTDSNRFSRSFFLTLCALSALLAFGSKENTFVLPMSIALYEIILVRKYSIGKWLKTHKRKWFTIVIACIGLTAAYLYLHQGGHMFSLLSGYHKRVFTLEQRLLTEPRVIWFYLSLLLYPLPSRLSLVHDFRVSQSLTDPVTTLTSVIAIAALLLGAAVCSRKWPLLAFCVIFFFLNHVIESTILPLELVFEHRNYIPSMLLFLPIAVLLVRLASNRAKRFFVAPTAAIIAVLLFGSAYATYARNWAWKNPETLWVDAVSKAPGLWRPWQNLGRVYVEKKEYSKALTLFLASLSKRTDANKNDKYLTEYNLGVVYQNLNRFDKALSHYNEAERLNPSFPGAHNNRGAIFFQQGKLEDAISELRKAATCDARNQAQALSNLGFLLIKAGKKDEAIHYLQIANRIKPNNPLTMNRLGFAYRKEGRFGKAYILFKKSLQVEPGNIQTALYLADLYRERKMAIQVGNAMGKVFCLIEEKGHQVFMNEFLLREENEGILLDRSIIISLFKEICETQSARFCKGS